MTLERLSVLLEREVGPPIPWRRPSREQIAAKQGILPDRLLDLWTDHGFAGYGRGLYWTTDPDEYAPLLALWPRIPKTAHVIGRDAFADLFYLQDGEVF